MNTRKSLAIIFFLFYGLLATYGQTKTTCQKLSDAAVKINKTMPQALDEYSEVDILKAVYPDTLQYYCRLLHVNKTSESLSRIKQILETKMLNTVKTDPVFQPYRANKIKIVYRYHDAQNVFLFSIFLTPDKYLN
jgi:hypothetical protein